ncbi:PEGA domain-containing protein [Methylophaga sp.]|uniref:PEGA domain-containing protein n=1 Tax=Methylophaga sp. TaxID=2024840 RepID=UPI003F6A18C9
MSEFKQAVYEAQKRAQKKRLFYAVGIIVSALILISFLMVSKGTRIEILPSEITDTAEASSPSTLAFVINGHLYSLTSEATVMATAEGFKLKTQKVTSADFGKVTTLTLDPLPSKLVLESSPEDDKTSWSINGELIAVDSRLEKVLDAGDYQVSLSHPYYESTERTYSLERGETVEETITLKPLSGKFDVTSTPDGAVITINNEEHGKTPTSLILKGGSYKVSLSKQGYDPVENTIEIKTNALNPTRHYKLQPKSAGIRLSLSPQGGTLTLNGINISPAAKIKVTSGKKSTISYKKPGYFGQSRTFTLEPEEVKSYTFDLKKEFGKVSVTANLPAEVYVNGKKVGRTPYETSLLAVEHQIHVKQVGYRTVKGKITPNADSTSLFNARLILEKEARLAEAPSTYKTKSGEEMVLFKATDTIDMGAERSEPGQRANEFVRTAMITKPFYAGRYEVTNAAYAAYKKDHSGPPTEPVSNVSWFDAVRYANWLSEAEGYIPVYKLNGDKLTGVDSHADGYRLLTESEWEWLARKAGRSSESLFSWGDDKTIPRKAANIADESTKGSVPIFVSRYDDGFANKSPVGAMQKEKSGLFDMGGNVSEWTHDAYTLIPPKKGVVHSHDLDRSLSISRVVKGANWQSGSLTELRSSYREGMEEAAATVGFRLGRFVYGGN